MPETIHFTGKFKDLIPNGWSFHKLYARNYRCYFYPIDGGQLVIWQSKRYVNFLNLFEEESASLMRFVIEGVVFEPYSDYIIKTLGFTGEKPMELVYNERTNKFRVMEGEEQWKPLDKHLKKYTLSPEFAALARKLYNTGFFEFKD